MERLVEHYTELYSSEKNVISSSLDDIESLPSMDELDANTGQAQQGHQQSGSWQSSMQQWDSPRCDQALQKCTTVPPAWKSFTIAGGKAVSPRTCMILK